VKRLADLNLLDLATSPVWRYDGGEGADATIAPTKRKALSQADDEIFLAATEFVLADGSRHSGFCFPADDSGIDYLQPVIISRTGHVSFWFDNTPEPDVLARQWQALGKKAKEIFPVSFKSLVPVDGRSVSGQITGVVSSQNLMTGSPAPTVADAPEPPRKAAGPAEGGLAMERVPTARPVQARRDTGPVEKRTARRRLAEMSVEFSQGALRGTGVIHNVSPRGMYVRSTSIPGTGPMLRLKVNLPEGRTLVLTGRVVRGATTMSSSGTPGFGLRLSEESQDYEDLLSRLKDKRK